MSEHNIYEVGSGELTYGEIERILKEGKELRLSDAARKRIEHCRSYLDHKTDHDTEPIYGVTTGFGSLCSKHISRDELSTLQENLVKSHSCSVGTPVSPEIVKLMLLLKAHALSMGFSGVQVCTVERIIDMYNNNVLPVVRDRGSLGASGDLAPLANLFLPLIGEGDVWMDGEQVPAGKALEKYGWEPIKLQSKEGLALLKGSEIIARHKEHVQDPYSFRCIPQVHGAVKGAMLHVTDVLHIEINSVTDNPTVYPDEDMVVSGGNFHGEPLALAFDYMGVALHELGNISERRVAQLIDGQRGLPEFLVAHPGLNSGFMIPQYAAASMVSQNKMYAWPASCDSIVSSNGQEDLVSMGANAATKLHKIIDNLKYIAAIELMNAAQGIEFRRPLKSSPYIEHVMEEYRKVVPFVQEDVVMNDYIRRTMDFLEGFDINLEEVVVSHKS